MRITREGDACMFEESYICTSNEIRMAMGLKPICDPEAKELIQPGIHRCTEDLIKRRIVCSSCKHFRTNGWIAPAGKCLIHPEFGNDPCALYEGGEKYVTYCRDFERRERE